MNFSTLGLKLSSFASKLMGISAAPSKLISADGLDYLEGDNGFFKTIWEMYKKYFLDLFIIIGTFVARLFYAIGHWMLTIIDFIFIFIRQMCGMNTDFSSLENVTESDVIFQFLFNDNVIRILRGLLAFALVVLIIFCIFAIVKSEYNFITQNGGSNSKRGILISTLKSLFLMAFVPVVVIGSIIMTNALLSTVYRATSGGADTSIGSQIFLASTYDANAYRRYANRNMKIPITFNFEEIQSTDNVSGVAGDGTVGELKDALLDFKNQSVWTRGFKTYLMFASDAFLRMSDVDAMDKAYREIGKLEDSPYHLVYDKDIYTTKEQYYVMADVIDYSVSRNMGIYFKTAQEVYESYFKVLNCVSKETKAKMQTQMPITRAPNGDYNFSVSYDKEGEVVTYTHKKDAKDESQGAVFVIALEKRVKEGDKEYIYYYPLLNGHDNFATDYVSGTGQVTVARGLFEEGAHPTAIREKDGVVEFYRDDLNVPILSDFIPKISYELPAGSHEYLGIKVLKGALNLLTGVDIAQFIPYVYISVDIWSLFTKTSNTVVDIENGYLIVDYNFSYKEINKQNVYNFMDINFIILFGASVILLGILLKILFGITFRSVDVLLLALSYPAVLATMPLDDGGSFKEWVGLLFKKLFGIYGVVIAINIVLLVLPTTWQIQFFTVADIENAIGLGIIGSTVTSHFLNVLFHFIFFMVALSSISGFATEIEQIIFLGKKKEDQPALLKDGGQVVTDLKKIPETIGNVVTGKMFIEGGKKILDNATAILLPGSAVVADATQKITNISDRINAVGGAAKSMKDKFSIARNGGAMTGPSDSGGGSTSSKEKQETQQQSEQKEELEQNAEAQATQEAVEDGAAAAAQDMGSELGGEISKGLESSGIPLAGEVANEASEAAKAMAESEAQEDNKQKEAEVGVQNAQQDSQGHSSQSGNQDSGKSTSHRPKSR